MPDSSRSPVVQAEEVAGTASRQPAAETRPVDVETIYRDYAGKVGRWASRLAGPDSEVEDLVHEVFLVVQKRLHTFRGESQIGTWLYGITIRVVADRRQARRWRRWFGLRVATAGAAGGLPEIATDDPSPLDRLEGEQARRVVYQILDRLPDAYRTVLILFEMDGLGGKEIAAVTGTSVASVWIRLHRARKQFADRFVAWESAKQQGGK